MTGLCLKMFVVVWVLYSTAAGKENEGGNAAIIGQFRFVAFVHTNMTVFRNETLTSIRSSCTGLIVSERYVLAPEYCVRDILLQTSTDDVTMVSSSVTVRAGTLVGTASRYIDYGTCMQERTAPLPQILTPPSSSASIVLLAVTPTFDFGPCVGAVIMLKKPFPKDIVPFCLSLTYSNSMVKPGEPSQGVLKYRRVKAGDSTFCGALPQSAKITWMAEHVCSETVYKIDSCIEDWTGPVVCNTKSGLRGVGMDSFYFGEKVSWLKAECKETDQLFKAYTMLGYYEEWITGNVNSSEEALFEEYERAVLRRARRRERPPLFGSEATRERRPGMVTIFLLIYLLLIT